MVHASNFERLHSQAMAELGVFKEMGLGDLLEEGLASHAALVSRLNTMFVDELKTTWVPKTLVKIATEQEKVKYENVLLGMPPAHTAETPQEVKDAVLEAIEQVTFRLFTKKGMFLLNFPLNFM